MSSFIGVRNIVNGKIMKDLKLRPSELRICFTLSNGQCFNWLPLAQQDAWIGVIGQYPLIIAQSLDSTFYCSLLEEHDKLDLSILLGDYFQTSHCLTDLYKSVNKFDVMICLINHVVVAKL
jgi:hypothetical protein